MSKQILIISPRYWQQDFSSASLSERIAEDARLSPLLQAIREGYSEKGEEQPELLLINAKQQSLKLKSLDLENYQSEELVLGSQGCLLTDLSPQDAKGESYRADLAGEGLLEIINLIQAIDLPCLAIASGSTALIYADLVKKYGPEHFSLAEDSQLGTENWRIFWPVKMSSMDSSGSKLDSESSLRYGPAESKFKTDPDWPKFQFQEAPLYLKHRGERELHPAIQGRLYRAKWAYLASDESESKIDCLAYLANSFYLGLIADFDYAKDARPAVVEEFLARTLAYQGVPENNEIRRAAIQARLSLSEEARKYFSEQIVRQILASKEFQEAKTIFLYRGVEGEVNLDSLIECEAALEKTFVYPYCASKTEMLALKPSSDKAWRAGSFSIPEPIPELAEEYQPADLDLILCPCAAFDEACNRVGMGAGYYDRFLAKCTKAYVMAVAFEAQKARYIESKPWDYPMDSVISETGRYFRRKD